MIRRVILTDEEREQLVRILKYDPKPYVRERAAAILKVADGQIATHVALSGLLQPRDPTTVLSWLTCYREASIEGLRVKPGRGRKPAFSPGAC